ncbi:MAG: DUF5723 family protein [Rikenellaceae bacterium]
MKKILLPLATIFAIASASAQDVTSYFMDDSYNSMQHNAAFAPDRGYFTIPLIGGISFNTSGNITLGNIIYNVDGSMVPFFDGSVSKSIALDDLKKGTNSIGVSNSLDILSFGNYRANHKDFWSFGISLQTQVGLSAPYEFFEFMKCAGENGQSYYEIEDISLQAESYAEFALGFSKVVSEKLTVGAKFKLLAGLANAQLSIDNMTIDINDSEWSVNTTGSMDISAAGIEIATMMENGNTYYDLDDISAAINSPAGWGAAIDLGATYDLFHNLQLSAAINDLGFISWKKSSTVSGTIANNVTYSGVDINSDEGVELEMDDIKVTPTEAKSGAKSIQATLNFGAEYDILGDRLSGGIVSTTRIWSKTTTSDLSAIVTGRPFSWLSASMSYTFTNKQANSVGLALNFSPSWINVYLATNILTSELSKQYIPINQSNSYVTLGIGIPIGKRSLRSKFTKFEEEQE